MYNNYCFHVQITSALSEYSPQGFALNRWNSELNDTRTRVVIRGQLPLSTDSSVLSIFADNGPPPGMFTFAGTPEIYGFIPSGTFIAHSRDMVTSVCNFI